jgi:hypothetical protein
LYQLSYTIFAKKLTKVIVFFFYENHSKQIYHLGKAIDLNLLCIFILIYFLYSVSRTNLMNVRLSLLVDYAPRRGDNDPPVEGNTIFFAEIVVEINQL